MSGLTRARSLLAIYGTTSGSDAGRQLTQTVATCVEAMNAKPEVESSASIQDDLNESWDSVGFEHRKWLVDLWKRFEIHQEPITDADVAVVAEPLFWFERGKTRVACFGTEPLSPEQRQALCTRGIIALKVGANVSA